MPKYYLFHLFIFLTLCMNGQNLRPKEYGIPFGVLPSGKLNAITDVDGVLVGQLTKIEGKDIRTGVTAILAHGGNIFQQKVPAAVFVGNGFGKLTGITQIQELGTLESPIILTNTLSVAASIEGGVRHTLAQYGNEKIQSVNIVVGETNDGFLNDIRGMYVTSTDVITAIQSATSGAVTEGNVGAGTGTTCFGWKGGIGTSSRKLPKSLGGFTVGVLVQTNFGGNLQISGLPVGQMLGKFSYKEAIQNADGSCMIVVATDAPVTDRNLERIAQRAMMGLAKTGGIASNGSGDYVIAFSTAENMRVQHNPPSLQLDSISVLHNNDMSPLFMATIEATEEAIINSLFMAETMVGKDGNTSEKLPIEKIIQWFQSKK
jgi:D-aminopeptidase